MFKFFNNKKYLIIGYCISLIISLVVLYISFTGSIRDVSADDVASIDSLQNIIMQIHTEDSLFFNLLLSGNVLSSELVSDENNFVISNLVNLKSSKLFSSQKLASTINDYYSITNIREQIIKVYKNGGSNDDSNNEINDLLILYEENVNIILLNVRDEIKYISEFQSNCLEIILIKFIIFEILLISLFLFLYFRSDKKIVMGSDDVSAASVPVVVIDENMIMDSDCRKILEFIGSETSRGCFPTFKDLKSHLGLSHPTVLAKVKDLESRKLIGIRKQGRNKHLFLR
ncbi:MAG: hypothetical protein HRU03_05680 [Nanoarchaeales archaeon]|nr:hypothetical protein [Nanoarchaeales archaeon]